MHITQRMCKRRLSREKERARAMLCFAVSPSCGCTVSLSQSALPLQIHMREDAMPQTVLSIATVKLAREMLRREDCFEGQPVSAMSALAPDLYRGVMRMCIRLG